MVIAVVVLIAAFFAYRFWWSAPAGSEPAAPGVVSVAGGAGTANTSPESDRFLYLLLSLQRLELKSDLFANQLFSQLHDFSTALPNLMPGRSNPFAPIGAGGAPAAVSQSGNGVVSSGTVTGGTAAGAPADPAVRQQVLDSLNQ